MNEQEMTQNAFVDVLSQLLDVMHEGELSRKQNKVASRQYMYNMAFEQHFKNGGGSICYSIEDENLIRAVTNELMYDNIPHRIVQINGVKMLQIRDTDAEHYKYTLEAAKIVLGNYHQELDLYEMANSIQQYSAMTEEQKVFVKFDGINEDFATMLKNKSNDITKGFMVGTEDIGNGTENLAVQSRKVLAMKQEKNSSVYSRDFCRAILAAELAYSGPNHDKNIEQLASDRKLNEYIMGYSGEPEIYLTGERADKNKSIHIAKDYIEFRTLQKQVDDKGNLVDVWVGEGKIYRDEAGEYKKALQKYSDMIFDEVICHSKEELDEHTQGIHKKTSERVKKNHSEQDISDAESIMCNKIDYAIKRSFQNDVNYDMNNIYHKNEEEIIKTYRERALETLQAIQTQEKPLWMRSEDFQLIMKEAETYQFKAGAYIESMKSLHKEVVPRRLGCKDLIKETLVYKQIQEQRRREQERERK